jgi:NADH:ubiquinone oxidoreductase subunit D
MLEMAESLNICNTVISSITDNKLNTSVLYQQLINKCIHGVDTKSYVYMEDLIDHFLRWHTGIYIKKGITFNYIESPKGEFGTILISNSSNKPEKCKIRSPSYFSLQFLPKLSKGHYLADLAALIGTIDIVFGEIDR